MKSRLPGLSPLLKSTRREGNMVLPGYFRKLMGWCPMKNSLGKRKQENNYPDFKLENGSIQLEPYPADPHESRILKVQVSLFDGEWVLWALIITFAALIVSLLLWTYSRDGSCLIILSRNLCVNHL